jgi:hypothetical protein
VSTGATTGGVGALGSRASASDTMVLDRLLWNLEPLVLGLSALRVHGMHARGGFQFIKLDLILRTVVGKYW